MKANRIAALFVAPILFASLPDTAQAGFAASTLGSRQSSGHYFVRLPDSGLIGGVTHDLNPASWYKFRIRVKHDDAQFPAIGWASDSFDPISGTIQICDVLGCEASEIDVGTESLDWSDTSKIDVYIEYKDCQLCQWNATLCPWE